jgi:hypothetical protein
LSVRVKAIQRIQIQQPFLGLLETKLAHDAAATPSEELAAVEHSRESMVPRARFGRDHPLDLERRHMNFLNYLGILNHPEESEGPWSVQHGVTYVLLGVVNAAAASELLLHLPRPRSMTNCAA